MPRLAQAQTATRRTIDASNFEDVEIAWEWMSVENFVSRSTAGGSEWWAPLDTIVEALVEDIPQVVARFTYMIERATFLLSDDNLTAISEVLTNLKILTTSLASSSVEFDDLAGDITASAEKVRQTTAGIDSLVKALRERIPTLVEAIKLVEGKLRFVIEIKPKGIENEVVAAIREAGATPDDVVIFCFHREVVETIKKLDPRLTVTWLIGDMPWHTNRRRETLADAQAAGATIIGLPKTRVDPSVVHLAHAVGLPVYVWTVNDPADMRYLARIGVDGIISDRTDILRQVIAEH